MSINFIQLQMQYFGNPSTGKPVSGGRVYVGVIDTDPEILGNRITVNITQEDGVIVPILPAAQPLTTNPAGFIQYLGSSVQVNTTSDFSIKVTDSAGNKLFYTPRVSNTIAASIVTYDNTTSGMTATDVQAALDELSGLSGSVTNWGGILGDITLQLDLQAQFVANKRLTIFTLPTATEIADVTHANNKVNMTNSGASTYQIDLGVFADGDQILIEQEGTGKVTVIGGGGVVLRSSGSLFATSGQNAIIAVINNGLDIWTVGGDRA